MGVSEADRYAYGAAVGGGTRITIVPSPRPEDDDVIVVPRWVEDGIGFFSEKELLAHRERKREQIILGAAAGDPSVVHQLTDPRSTVALWEWTDTQ